MRLRGGAGGSGRAAASGRWERGALPGPRHAIAVMAGAPGRPPAAPGTGRDPSQPSSSRQQLPSPRRPHGGTGTPARPAPGTWHHEAALLHRQHEGHGGGRGEDPRKLRAALPWWGGGRPDPRVFMCDPPAPRGIGTWRVRGGEMLVQLWRWQGLALHLLKADSQLELGKCSFFCCIPSSCHCHPREPPGPAPWGGRGHIEDTEVPAVTEKRGRVPGGRTLPGPHGGSGDPGAGTGTRLPFRWPSAHRGDSGTRCGQ